MMESFNLNNTIIAFVIILLYLIYVYAFKNGYPTCENYVINTYLYLALSVCYIYFNVTKLKSYANYPFLAFIVAIISMLYISLNKAKTQTGILINHTVWFLFLTCMSLLLIPIASISSNEMINTALYFTFTIFIIMSALVYFFPKFFEKNFNFVYPGLLVSLIMIILIELYYIYIKQNYPIIIYRYISYAIIVIFSLYVSYDTQLMFEEAEICRKYANYPESSIKFILDVVNIFVRTLALQKN